MMNRMLLLLLAILLFVTRVRSSSNQRTGRNISDFFPSRNPPWKPHQKKPYDKTSRTGPHDTTGHKAIEINASDVDPISTNDEDTEAKQIDLTNTDITDDEDKKSKSSSSISGPSSGGPSSGGPPSGGPPSGGPPSGGPPSGGPSSGGPPSGGPPSGTDSSYGDIDSSYGELTGAEERQDEPRDAEEWPCSYDKWPDHSPDCFRALDKSTYESFMEKIGINAITGTEVYKKLPSKFLKGITANDVSACKTKTCLTMLVGVLQYGNKNALAKTVFAGINGDQLKVIIIKRHSFDTSGKEPDYYRYLDAFPEDKLEHYGVIILSLIKYKATLLSDYSLKAVLKNPKSCKLLDSDTIIQILSSPKSKLVTPECIKEFNLSGVEISKLSSSLPKNAFESTNGPLSPALTKLLTKEHVENLASKVEAARYPGKSIQFCDFKKKEIAAGITPAVIIGKLGSVSKPTNLLGSELKTNFAGGLHKDIFKKVSTEDGVTGLGKLDHIDLQAMSPDVIQTIVDNHPYACSQLPAVNMYGKIKFNSIACFNMMSPAAQAIAFVSANTLNDEIVKNLSLESFKEWEVPSELKICKKKDGSSCAGIDVFDHGKHRSNIGEIIANFSADPNGQSACSGLGTAKAISTSNNLSNFITVACFDKEDREFPNDAKDAKDARIHERLKLLKPYVLLRDDMEIFKKLTSPQLLHLINGQAFCPFVEKDIFNLIPLVALNGMTGKCVTQLQIKDQLTKEHIEAFAVDVFATVPANILTPNMIDMMSPDQVRHACTKVTGSSENNLGAVLTETNISNFSVEKIAALSGEQWKLCKPDAFKGLSAEKLGAIIPENMVHWTDDQVRQAPTSIWKALTVEHANMIGTSAPTGKAPHKYLLDLGDISNSVKEVLRKHEPPTLSTEGEWSYTTLGIIIAAVVGGIIIIGGAIFFFLNR